MTSRLNNVSVVKAAPTEATRERKRICIETFGCSFNASDSEVMAGLLQQAGYEMVESPEAADIVIVNSCIVKNRSYLDIRKRLGELEGSIDSESGKRPIVILAGCAPKVPEHGREFGRFPQVSPDNVDSIVEVVQRACQGQVIHRVERRIPEHRLALPKRRKNPAVEIVPIARGCLGKCSFCQTVLARGRLYSFSEDEIETAVRNALREGVKEIWLTGQDCGAYGLDRGTTLPRLLERLARVEGTFVYRLGMINPNWARLYAKELAEIYAHPRFFRFAHVPLQSGSDSVLRAMRREYTVSEFLEVCDQLRSAVPDISIATDIIAGFPTETEEDWVKTLDVLRRIEPAVVNRSRFSPRPGTAAARLSPLPSKIVARRSRELYSVTAQLVGKRLSAFKGQVLSAIVEENPRAGVSLARTETYSPVVIDRFLAPGTYVTVLLEDVEGFHLRGKVVDEVCATR